MATDVTITILGCGGSSGVPMATNYWGKCDPSNPKNARTRSSIAIRTERTCVIIDTGPDFRQQTIRENLEKIDAVLYTHAHSDHINGIDDVRYAVIKQRINGNPDVLMPIYANKETLDEIMLRFEYLFQTSKDGLYIPLMKPNVIDDFATLEIGDITLRSFVQDHGMGQSLGFRVGDFAYSTDVTDLSEQALHMLKGVKTWVVDCNRYHEKTITVHPTFARVMEWQETIQAEKLYFTHLNTHCDYDSINAETPDYIECAYDGLNTKTTI